MGDNQLQDPMLELRPNRTWIVRRIIEELYEVEAPDKKTAKKLAEDPHSVRVISESVKLENGGNPCPTRK